MSKEVRLKDFQICGGPMGNMDEERAVNIALFSSYEPVRLWLKERTVKAPFGKIVVSLSDERIFAPWHGHVMNAIGICQVTEAVNLPTLRQNIGDHSWVLGLVLHALGCVARRTEWRSSELEDFIATLSERTLPFVHFFDRFERVDKKTGVKCVPWFSIRPGENKIGLRMTVNDSTQRDVTVFSQPGNLYMEDSFPLAKTVIRASEFMFLDKTGKVLASVPIHEASDSSTH